MILAKESERREGKYTELLMATAMQSLKQVQIYQTTGRSERWGGGFILPF